MHEITAVTRYRLLTMVPAGVFCTTYSLMYGGDPNYLFAAVCAFGPILMLNGWLAHCMSPTSTTGTLTVLSGFNYLCGVLLCGFKLQTISLLHPDLRLFWLVISLIAITVSTGMITDELNLEQKTRRIKEAQRKQNELKKSER